MKNIALALVGIFMMSAPLIGQEKRLSPAKTTENTVGDLSVVISYSSPSVKGRTIYGDLVPWGEIWRAGANEATTIKINKDAMVNGEELPAGHYAFFVIPNEDDDWTLIFNKVHEQWGAYKYDDSEDMLRIDVSPEEIDPTEELTYSISDEGEVNLDWSTTRVGFTIK